MLRLELVTRDLAKWPDLSHFADRTIWQTPAWLGFVVETQHAEPILAEVRDGADVVGYYTGLIVRKFGLKILGSPMTGWTTAYMGFNLLPGVSRREALAALLRFAFEELGCVHTEFMDMHLTVEEADGLGFEQRPMDGFQVDLAKTEEELFAGFSKTCRWSVRKAEKLGVVVEEATDESFADDFYSQLMDVFGKQSLVPTYPIERVRALMRHLLPVGQLLLLRARDPEGRCIASGIFPGGSNFMVYWGGASWREYQHLLPNEAIQWYAMRYWQARGMKLYDMMGKGEYKRKYGGKRVSIPWFRKSRSPIFETARRMARAAFGVQQRVRGRLRAGNAATQGSEGEQEG
jgi:hypothetical protein